jgi:hypothetical protein
MVEQLYFSKDIVENAYFFGIKEPIYWCICIDGYVHVHCDMKSNQIYELSPFRDKVLRSSL